MIQTVAQPWFDLGGVEGRFMESVDGLSKSQKKHVCPISITIMLNNVSRANRAKGEKFSDGIITKS